MALVALYGLWKPASVFDNVQAERAADARSGRRHQAAGRGTGRSIRPC